MTHNLFNIILKFMKTYIGVLFFGIILFSGCGQPDSKKTISTPDQTVTPVVNPFTSTPVQTAPGMNPPHGQQGHDCAIAVGAPLNK